MSVLDPLAACAGTWRGTNTLHDPHTQRPEESASTATVTPVLGGRFVRLDYTWGYQGKPQDGSLLVGYDEEADAITGHWIDSWHMGRKAFACLGPRPADGVLSLRGSWAPEWGWRIDVTPEATPAGAAAGSGGSPGLRVVMLNINPDKREDPAVDALYTRA